MTRHRILDRTVAASNAKFDVFFDRIDGPDGVVPQFLMVRPKVLHADLVSGVCVLPEVEGRIGLMRTVRPHFPDPIWVAPSGFVEPGEPTEVSALRELREETGYVCDPADLRPLGLLLIDPAVLEARAALFVATNLRRADGAPEGGELGVGDLVFFAPDELLALAVESPSMDGGTVAACLRWLAGRISAPPESGPS